MIGKILQPEAFERFVSAMHADSNKALDGWFFEVLFFVRLRKGALVLTELGSIEGSSYEVFSPESFPILGVNQTIWLKPARYNQGGYDAVFVDISKKVIQVFQIASGMNHAFDIGHFRVLMDNFYQSNIHFKDIKFELEIIYVVDSKKLEKFAISSVTGQGLLEDYGWSKNTEHKKVKIVGMRGF
jgi:hypothetical protein